MAIQNILIVDDSPTERYYLTDILVRNGFSVTTADNARDARAKLTGLSFDLLVLDVMMPKLDGFEVLRRLPESQRSYSWGSIT
mgnify:CR=1 FL=1